MGEANRDPGSGALALFKQFLAERWFGGPDFDSWVRQHGALEQELRRLRDEWLAEIRDPDSPGLVPDEAFAARSASSLEEGEVIAGFRLRKRLGSGASGEVWVAQELALGGRAVALKLLRPDLILNPRALERFRREALAGASIRHPGVVAVYSVGRYHGQPYIAMELVEGGETLADWLTRERSRSGSQASHFRRVANLVLQAAEALAEAHSRSVLHRDIKPANILVGPNDQLKIADFGLARILGEGGLSRTGDVMGTFSYMSPEQMRGEVHQLDGRTDMFSLGATFYELLTFQRAFPGRDYHEIAQKILHEDPRPPRKLAPALPRDFELVCSKALQKSRTDRYSSMSAFADDLRRLLAGESPVAKSTTIRAHVRKWTRRHPAATAAGTLLVASALVLRWYSGVHAEENRALQHEALLTRAQLTIEQGDLEQAERLVDQADVLDPEDPTGHLLLASGFAQQGRVPEVEAALKQARERGFQEAPERLNTALEHQAYGLYLQSLRDFGRYPEAERHLVRALELDPGLHGAHLVLYQLRIATGDVAGALSALEAFQAYIPEADPLHDIVTALRQEWSGDPGAALATLDALRAQPGMSERRLVNLRWHRNAGRVCVRLGEEARAEEYLKRAVLEAPTDCWSLDSLGVLYFQRLMAGDRSSESLTAAREFADRASACSASLENPHLIRAWLATYAFGREPASTDPEVSPNRREARQALEALAHAPESISSQAHRIESFLLELEARGPMHAGAYAAAAGLYERATELDPHNLQAAELLGQCDYWLGRHAEGLAVLQAARLRWEDPASTGVRDPKVHTGILVWSLGNAARLDDRDSFIRARDRFQTELEGGAQMQVAELLNAAEFLATAPESMRDCELALLLLDEHGVRRAFESTQARILSEIEEACYK